MALTETITEGTLKIPSAIMRAAGLQNGVKVAFRLEGTRIVIENANLAAWNELQNSMLGAAEEAGLTDEYALNTYLEEIRKEVRGY